MGTRFLTSVFSAALVGFEAKGRSHKHLTIIHAEWFPARSEPRLGRVDIRFHFGRLNHVKRQP